MSFAPYFSRNFSNADLTALAFVMGAAWNSVPTPRASIPIVGCLSTFLYHWLSDPFTGRRYSLSLSDTNQTGIEIVFPDFLPITLILIWRERERRSFNSFLTVVMLPPICVLHSL